MPAAIKPQPGPQECFLSTAADIAIYGGAAGGGKSFALLLEPLRYLDVPGFNGLILRRTNKEVMNVGGLWHEADGIYSSIGAEPRVSELCWKFPSGVDIKFDHLEHENDKHKYQGAQAPFIGFDELTRFTETQFWYMLSRNRSTCGVSPYVRATCNPDASSWVAKLIAWWIDQRTGLPIAERAGMLRWFIRRAGQLVWRDSAAELEAEYPGCQPKSLTFIPATLDDNPALTSKDPGYRANLEALPHVEQERLLHGNWKVLDSEGAEWPGEYFDDLYSDQWPAAFELSAIAVDPSKGREKGDYSAIVFVGVTGGLIYVDADLERRPVPSIVEDTANMAAAYGPQVIGFEANGFQDLIAPEFDRYCMANRLPPYPIELIENYGVAKEVRIRRLGGWLRSKRIKLRRNAATELLVQQMMMFPLGDHDDGPDALEMAIRLLDSLASAGVTSIPQTVRI